MAGCEGSRGGAGMGSTCRTDNDCGSGLVCRDDLCVSGPSGGGGEGEGGDAPRFFLHIGGTLGLGYASQGMQADSYPCSAADAARDPSDPLWCPAPNNPTAFVGANEGECGLEAGYYCVRVSQSGMVPVAAIRVAAGYYILDWLGIAVYGRFQPVFGQGDFAFGVIGARLQLQLTEPVETGFHAHVHAGGGGGQVQIQPPGNDDNAPYIISGYGNISLGSTLGYRVHRHFGFIAEVDFLFQVPTFMFVTDITVGVEVAF
jgi:hypothetical protein